MVDIFEKCGIEVDVNVGLFKEELIEIIGEYDGFVVCFVIKVMLDVIKVVINFKVIGWVGIGVDNIDIFVVMV